MYDELIRNLRNESKYALPSQTRKALIEAADAIEELLREYTVERNAAVELTGELASKPRWIPVTERLPEDNEAVNVVWVNHSPVIYYQHIKDKPQTSTGVYYRGQWYWWSAVTQDYLAEYGKWEPDLMDTAVEVTHWMPLPEPPKEEPQIISAVDCKDCRYYPPSSLNGKPCTQCDMGNPLMNCFSQKEET